MKSRAAFTLIELLTVIAIIGILAAILIPTVGRARTSAKASQSASNLRQLGQTTLVYASDNKGRLPRGHDDGSGRTTWSSQLQTYFSAELRKTIYANPNAPVYPSTAAPFNTYSSHPMFNSGTGGSGKNFLTISDITSPSRFIVFGDGAQLANTQSSLSFTFNWINRFGPLPAGKQSTDPLDGDIPNTSTSGLIGYYNAGKAHVVRLDASVRTIAPGELTYGDFAWR